MGYYLSINDDAPPLATGTGWGDFGRWAESLPADRYEGVIHLYRYGWWEGIPALSEQLAAALEAAPPESGGVKAIAENLLEILKGGQDAVVVSVTDGMESESEDEEDEPEESDAEPEEPTDR